MKRNKSAILEALRNAAVSEPLSVAFLEKQRWGDRVTCPRCWGLDVYQMKGRDGERNKDYRWRCRECKQFFTVSHRNYLRGNAASVASLGVCDLESM
jgi:transposase-like protein